MRKAWWLVVVLVLAGAALWFFWPEDAADAQVATGRSAQSTSSANEGFVPAERKPSAWTEPVRPRGSLSIRGKVLGPDGPVAGAQVTATAAHGDDVLSDLICKCDNECGLKLLKCGCPEASGQIVELVSSRTGEAQPVARTLSGEDGSYLLEGVDEQEVAIWADAAEGVGYLATATGGQENADPYGSTILLFSRLSLKDSIINPQAALIKQLRIQGWFLANWLRQKNLIQALLLARKAQSMISADLQSPINQRLPLSAAQEGLESYLSNMSGGKILFVMNQS
jgi:hypothetical protein